MKRRSGHRTQTVAAMVAFCLSGCAGTGDLWRSDGKDTAASVAPEVALGGEQRSPTGRDSEDEYEFAPRSRLVSFSTETNRATQSFQLPANLSEFRLSPGTVPAAFTDELAFAQTTSAQESSVASAEDSSIDGEELSEEEKIGEALANPLSYLWLLFMQNDTFWYDGNILDDLDEDPVVQNSFLLNPVLSFQLTEEWKTIFRPVVPINSFETLDNVNVETATTPPNIGVDLERETGLGDIVLWTAFSNQYQPPLVWGFGPTVMLNTATDNQLGTGKFSAGPMGLVFNITDQWIFGGIAQHWWSFAGEDSISVDTTLGRVRADRPDVNLTDIQPVIRYRLSKLTNIGMAPNWRYNWETDQLSLPIGIGTDTLIKLGPLPVKVGVEAYYYVENDEDFGPEWQLRFLFIPVVPSPEWSRTPIFGD